MAASYTFGPFRIDTSAEILLRGTEPVQVGRRAVSLLRALIERPGVPVSKDALIEAAWPGLAVEENNLAVQIAALRKVLGEERGGDKWIETLPRRGYRFVGPSVTEEITDAPAPRTSVTTAVALPDRPSIAVLPFQNMSGDPAQEYFADGMVEEIITSLSRIRWLFVIARNSSFTYKGKSVDVKQVGSDLGVRYVLEGSVRKASDRVRIACQLIDVSSGAHLWADHFDGSLEDIFELQDKVAVAVAGVIEPTLVNAEIRRSAQRPTTDLTAYDLYLRALEATHSWEKEEVLGALNLLKQALERAPHYGPALGLASQAHMHIHFNAWTNDKARARYDALDLARRALQRAQGDPGVLTRCAWVMGYFGEDIVPSLTLIDQALEFNPSFALGWNTSGWLRLWAGQPDFAIAHFERFIRLSPLESRAGPYMGIGLGHFFARRFEEAKMMLALSLQEKPSWAPTHRFIAACYAHMGQLDEARQAFRQLQEITATPMPSVEHWRKPEHRELFLSGLRLAAGLTNG
jgi:adenylate cyclase